MSKNDNYTITVYKNKTKHEIAVNQPIHYDALIEKVQQAFTFQDFNKYELFYQVNKDVFVINNNEDLMNCIQNNIKEISIRVSKFNHLKCHKQEDFNSRIQQGKELKQQSREAIENGDQYNKSPKGIEQNEQLINQFKIDNNTLTAKNTEYQLLCSKQKEQIEKLQTEMDQLASRFKNENEKLLNQNRNLEKQIENSKDLDKQHKDLLKKCKDLEEEINNSEQNYNKLVKQNKKLINQDLERQSNNLINDKATIEIMENELSTALDYQNEYTSELNSSITQVTQKFNQSMSMSIRPKPSFTHQFKCCNCNKDINGIKYQCLFCSEYNICNVCLDLNISNTHQNQPNFHQHSTFIELKDANKHQREIKTSENSSKSH